MVANMFSRPLTQFVFGLFLLVSSNFACSLSYTLSSSDSISVSIAFYNDSGSLQFSENATSNGDGTWSVVLDDSTNFLYAWVSDGIQEDLFDNVLNNECFEEILDAGIQSDFSNYAVRRYRENNSLDFYDSCSGTGIIVDGLSYLIIGENAVLNGCGNFAACEYDQITIPPYIQGYPVTAIRENVFQNTFIEQVNIPETIMAISNWAFHDVGLIGLNVNSGTEVIGIGAFMSNNLTELWGLPDTVKHISSQAFAYNNIDFINFSKNIEKIDRLAFQGNSSNMTLVFKGDRPDIATDAFASNNINGIYYCNGSSGWPGSPIEGVIPQLDDGCSNEVNDFSIFDMDQSGSVDALTDGLIFLRYVFGLRGAPLVNDVISPNATRTSAADIEAHIESHMP
jgi:hypothetical protein